MSRVPKFRPAVAEMGLRLLGVLILVWSVTPIYNMLLIALDPEEGEIEFDGNIFPPEPSLEGFRAALTQQARYLENFWHQFGNSLAIGLLTMVLTVLISSLASFAVSRLWVNKASLLANAALVTYIIPASLLIIPLDWIMHGYGLSETLWAVVASQVTFALPFGILILLRYVRLIPYELDEAARIDGASAVQMYLRIYLPLMAPALAVVAIYALLLAWNDYIYQFVLLSSARNQTVSVMQAQLFVDADAQWNAMMAAAIIYTLPPVAIACGLCRYIATRLTMAGANGYR